MNTIAFFACINSIVIMVIIIIFWYTYIEDSQSFPIRFLAGSCLGGIVVALIWVVNTDISIHATIMATFVWPYAAGYAWASVISRARSRRRLSGAILQAIVITILMATALILVIDATPALVTNLNNTLNINFIIVKVLVNGYIIITCSGLVIDIFIFAILIRETIYAVRKIQQENSEFQEKQRQEDIKKAEIQREEEEERIRRRRASIPREDLRLRIIQALEQGKKVSHQDFPDVEMSRIQNAMAIIEQELDEADLDYNIQATTIAYHNAEGVQRIYNACLTGEFQPDILVQRFLKELGLPAASRLNDHSDLSFYVAKAQSASLVAVLPAEFPIFVPTLTEKAAREDDIRKRFQGIFNKASPRNQFGLILSPSRGPFLRNALTQPDEDGIEDNIVFLDEDDMRTIITRKIEPQIAFIDFVRRSIRLTRISPFITEGPTRQLVFVGREQEIRTVEENIAEHSSAINGSRRIGKTSVLMQIEQSLRKQGCKVFFLECSAASNYSDFFHIIRDEWKDELGSFVQQIEETPLGFRDIVTILQYNELQKTPVVFILDEIDRLLQYDKQQEASYLLFRTFRDLSQRERCQFVFGGERYVFQQHSDSSSPLFNFCKYIQLGLLSREDAHKLVGPSFQLLNIRLEDEQKLIDYIADMCSYHPNLIQYVCQRILDGLEPQGKSLRPTITWELARKVVRHPKFKEEYVNVFWGQSTPLEKAITLLAPEHGSFTSQSIFEELKKYGFEITRERFTMALKYLILCNIFNDDDSDNQGLYWTADHFKEFLDLKASDQTILIEELRSQFPRDR